ncbi:beta-catenin-like protein-like protein 1 [Elsinoe ampelina]|uniref:Beta-catenin-like protein-like protein 1 n=1 Tax=Elsinoe ampelina TaxID=302913 RepID=A0A6A6GRC4_9PEZI|nr:beta-catenin-like protein-like protein 1 [Elsinoe ampelina]
MTSIDDLFRKPNGTSLPLTNGKRKLEVPDATQVYKSTKLSASDDAKHGSNGQATVEEEDEEDVESGPMLPLDEDEASDDEEGRFFGGGVTRDTRQAMDFLEGADGEEIVDEKIDAAWARRLATNLERKINKNSEQRARYEGQPEKFMQSEAELDEEIKGLSNLTEHSEYYADFVQIGGAEQLVGLLAHDNIDIAINAIEIIAELLDEDVEVEQEQWDTLAEAMLKPDLVNLLVQNLERCDETGNESDRQGVYHSLAVLEALGSQSTTTEKAGTEAVLRWLLGRIYNTEDDLSQNKQYAAEVLQVLLQESTLLRSRVVKLGGVDVILQLLAAYRRKDPDEKTLEEEFAFNLFNTLICLVQQDEGKQAFIDGEGTELMLIMIREGKMSKSEAFKVLDHATVSQGQAVCEKIVEAAGLKTIFGVFKKKLDNKTIENVLDILSAMLRFLPGDSSERIRTLAKFTEKDCEKISKLLEWRQKYSKDLSGVDKQISKERRALTDEDQLEMADQWYFRRLDAGLVVLQTLNVILAWLFAEDKAAAKAIRAGLENVGEAPVDVIKALKEQLDSMDKEVDEDYAEMLEALIGALPS